MNKGGFSWKRLTGVSRAKSKISRATGIPLTKSGRQRKVGKIVTGGGCLMVMVSFGISCLGLVLLSMVSGGLLHAAGVEKMESPATPATVRAAAVQCHSVMGETEKNLARIASLAGKAVDGGAKIVVFPECAVQGYMAPDDWQSWSADSDDPKYAVQAVAEPVPGPSTKRLGALAKNHGIYLCIGLIEADAGKFYNAQILFAPDGTIVGHHRKKSLWMPGDGDWCTPGDLPVQVVDTEYGRLGLMICYDFHSLPPLLAEKKADIVLYSVGWYGPNEKNWFANVFPRKAVIPHGFHVVSANWSGRTENESWPGRGHSCIIRNDGTVLRMSESVTGDDIIIADLPIGRRKTADSK